MDELLLVEASQAGDKDAFGSLIDRYYKRIYRFAYQYTGHHHDADEVCQETFLLALDSIRRLRDHSCFERWIFKIALNLLRKRVGEIKRRKKLVVKSLRDLTVETTEDKCSEPFEALSAKEKAMIIHEELERMPKQMRLATILILMEGLTQKDAAGILNCSEASLSRCLDRAREWLRAKLRNLL